MSELIYRSSRNLPPAGTIPTRPGRSGLRHLPDHEPEAGRDRPLSGQRSSAAGQRSLQPVSCRADKARTTSGTRSRRSGRHTPLAWTPKKRRKSRNCGQTACRLAPSISAALESEVFSHLYNFFRRYYNEGDFISLRRYKEGVYAIPYEGEEVKLHWANADQYYVKSSEYFRDYTFMIAIRQAGPGPYCRRLHRAGQQQGRHRKGAPVRPVR